MKLIVLAILLAVVVWNGFVSLLGTMSVLGEGPFSSIAAVLFTLLVFGFLLGTRKITQVSRSKGGFVAGLLILFWIVAVLYGFYISWIGHTTLIIPGDGNFAQFTILFGLTLLAVSSPILLSVFWSWGLGQTVDQTNMPLQTTRRPVGHVDASTR